MPISQSTIIALYGELITQGEYIDELRELANHLLDEGEADPAFIELWRAVARASQSARQARDRAWEVILADDPELARSCDPFSGALD